MKNRLYDNGMLTRGEVHHCTCWEYPTMPRLNRDPAPGSGACERAAARDPRSRKQGYVALFLDLFLAD